MHVCTVFIGFTHVVPKALPGAQHNSESRCERKLGKKTQLTMKQSRKEDKTMAAILLTRNLNETRTPCFSPLHNSPDVLLIVLLEKSLTS